MTGRRALLAAAPFLAHTAQRGEGAAAEEEFPADAAAAGRPLVLNGTGERSWLGVPVYRAALYLERRSADWRAILASAQVKLIRVRYRRGVPLAALAQAWDHAYAASCGCAPPEALRRWLRPIAPGDEEAYLFLPEAAELAAMGYPGARLAGGDAARTLLAIWIGPAAPSAALRRGLLGER